MNRGRLGYVRARFAARTYPTPRLLKRWLLSEHSIAQSSSPLHRTFVLIRKTRKKPETAGFPPSRPSLSGS
jgi:hypothetical protein